MAEDLQEEFSAGLGEGYEAEFVDDEQLETCQLLLEVEQSSLVSGLYELVDQGWGDGETHREAPLAGGESQPQRHVGLAVAQ